MTTTAEELIAGAVQGADVRRRWTMDELARAPTPRLRALFEAGTVPESLAVLDGEPPGRMLTWEGPVGRSPLMTVLRAWGQSSFFPWAGKTFRADDATHGHGRNRLRLGRTLRVVPFEARVDASGLDGRPCIRLDYDLPENPAPIRRIRDELREIGPGVFVGPAMWQRRSGPLALFWFGVEVAG